MSLSQPDSNIKLNQEQVKQLEVFNSLVLKVQSEIKIYEKEKSSTIKENDRLNKERIYLTELFDNIKDNVDKLTEKETELKNSVKENEEKNKSLIEEQKQILSDIVLKKEELEKEKKSLEEKNKEYSEKQLKLEESIANHEQEKKDLENKKSLISELLSKL